MNNQSFRKLSSITPIEDLKVAQEEGLGIYAMLYVYPPKPLDLRSLGVGGWRRRTLPVLRSPARRDVEDALCFFTDTRHGHGFNEETTPEQLKGEGSE